MVATERALATIDTEDTYRRLDVYAGGRAKDERRLDAIATISAGDAEEKTNDKGKKYRVPYRSKAGEIYLHDRGNRASGLAEALKATSGKTLTIAFPFNNLDRFIQHHFVLYNTARLLMFGDEYKLTTISEAGVRDDVPASDRRYAELVKTCKVATSIYFTLAAWENGEPSILFPDGLGLYRIRTTSRNSVLSLEAAIQSVKDFTGGRLAGIPFECSIDYREVAGPDGSRRTIPVWAFAPLKGIVLTSRNFQVLVGLAYGQGAALMLPSPSAETIDDAERAYDDGEFDLLQRGGACDARDIERRWFAMVKGTTLEGDEARATFVAQYCADNRLDLTSSLAELLKHLTMFDALDFLSAAERKIIEDEDDALADMDPETGELPLSDTERAAASGAAAEALKADLFAVEPEPQRDFEHEDLADRHAEERAAAKAATVVKEANATAFGPSVVKPWFTNAVKTEGASQAVTWDVGRSIGDLMASVLQSPAAGIDITRYLVDSPTMAYERLTVAEEKYIRKLTVKPNAREQLMAVHTLAVAWLAEQKKPAQTGALS